MAGTVASSTADRSPASASQTASSSSTLPSPLPRITIRFCTQCKWMLRAAYFAQELLSTFSVALGEVALQPATGGVFVVEIYHAETGSKTATSSDATSADPNPTIQRRVLWDRKIDGGFPETKELKRRVRDVIEPDRNLGHVDRDYPRPQQSAKEEPEREPNTPQSKVAAMKVEQLQPAHPPPQKSQEVCEDCQ
ncbi:Rdx family-domain-containing protein [Xylaria nigripes]|nr:Rdx family-domain-containing protein [Xylaria nigripes]